jgi:hypothetical protein
MLGASTPLKGIVHGRTIELEAEPGFADGQEVTVVLRPALISGDGIRQSAGGWADADDTLDVWLDEMQRSRQQDRPELP